MTKPTAGVPHHSDAVITKVIFETTHQPEDAPGKYVAGLLARTVGHLDRVPVEALVERALRDQPDHRDLDYFEVRERRLLLTALVESVLDEGRAALRTGMTLDVVATLFPLLEKKD